MQAISNEQTDADSSATDANFSEMAVPLSARLGRWKIAMSFWSILSAMVWLFYGALVSSLYGTKDAVVAIVLSVVFYSVLNILTTRLGIRRGLNTALLTNSIFGRWGALLTALLVGATTLYYAVFESSVLAVGFHTYFNAGDIRLWYAFVVLGMLPLMLGSVQSWMGKINGILLPFYAVGLAATLIAAFVKFGNGWAWLDVAGVVPQASHMLPGWVLGFILYMGNFILMPTTIDFARFAKQEDEKFHEHVTFGWVFYVLLIFVNSVAGIYLVQTVLPNSHASETGVVQAIIASLGFWGLLLIVVSQTRINTLNYYLSTTNLERVLNAYSRWRLPRIVWVSVVALAVFLLMLTDVFSYIGTAMIWQGVLLVGWFGVVLTHFGFSARNSKTKLAVHDDQTPRIRWGLFAWIVPSVIGIVLLQASGIPVLLKEAAVPIVLILSMLWYGIAYAIVKDRPLQKESAVSNHINDKAYL